jgi:hypothetical protein
MKNLLILGLMITALVLAQFAQAQTVDEVIDKYATTIGGKEKLASIKSVYMQGVSEMNGNEITNTTYKVQDKLFRNEINFGMGTLITLITPEKGWRSNPRNGGAFEPMSPEQLSQSLHQMDCGGALINYAAKGHKAELIGKDSVAGNLCYKIKLTTKGGKELFYWINASTSLLDQVSQKGGMGGGRGGDMEITTQYRDYKAVDGIMYPFTAELKGSFGGVMTYEKIEMNKPVDEKLYKPE